MDRFWRLFEQSIIMQSVLTLLVVGAYLAMVLMTRPVPDLLETMVGLVLGFFFGSKVGFKQGSISKE